MATTLKIYAFMTLRSASGVFISSHRTGHLRKSSWQVSHSFKPSSSDHTIDVGPVHWESHYQAHTPPPPIHQISGPQIHSKYFEKSSYLRQVTASAQSSGTFRQCLLIHINNTLSSTLHRHVPFHRSSPHMTTVLLSLFALNKHTITFSLFFCFFKTLVW